MTEEAHQPALEGPGVGIRHTGNLTQRLLDCEDLVCVDISQQMEDLAKEKVARFKNRRFIKEDILFQRLKNTRLNGDTHNIRFHKGSLVSRGLRTAAFAAALQKMAELPEPNVRQPNSATSENEYGHYNTTSLFQRRRYARFYYQSSK
jgi:hypothetical protein